MALVNAVRPLKELRKGADKWYWEILVNLLGYDWKKIEDLKQKEII